MKGTIQPWLSIQCLENEHNYCGEVFLGGWWSCSCPCHLQPEELFGIWPPVLIL